MAELRPDIAEATGRMRRTFGTRSAIRNLHVSLEESEVVVAMLACLYAGSDGLLVLTTGRVLAIRDDLSKFRLQAVRLTEARALDYAPAIHDGLAVLTDTGRIAVRQMDRADSDYLTAQIIAAVPSIVVGASRPQAREAQPEPANADGVSLTAAASAALSGQTEAAAEIWTRQADAAAATRALTSSNGDAASTVGSTTQAALPAKAVPPSNAGVSSNGTSPSNGGAGTSPDHSGGPGGEADKDVLLGVLADLHAKGLLTADELADKIAKVASSS